MKVDKPSGQGRQKTLSVRSSSPRISYPQVSAKQARRRSRSGATEVSKPSSDANALRGPSRAIHQQQNPEAEEAGGMENIEHLGCSKQACLGSSRKWVRKRCAWPSSSPLGTTAEEPAKAKIEGVGPCTF